MARQPNIRAELESLRAELEALRHSRKEPPPAAEERAGDDQAPQTLEQQIRHLTELAEDMLEEAEDTVASHPVASVAGALALGIVIGRLTAR